MKKMIEDFKDVDELIYSSTLFEMREQLDKLIAEYGDAALDYRNITAHIVVQREETEQEYQKRLKKEVREKQEAKVKKEKQEIRERKEYERLKEKFG